MNKYEVGKALGIVDPVTGDRAICILYDGDSVLCLFMGSAAKENADSLCAVLNSLEQFQVH